MVNRYNEFQPVEFDLPLFVPNFELLAQSLEQKQNNFDQVNQLASTSFNSLEGKDTETRDLMIKERNDFIDNLANEYARGTSQGDKALNDMKRKIVRDHLPGGKAYSIQNQYNTYTEFAKSQKERLEKGEITEASYWASVVKPLEDYKPLGIGDDPSNPRNMGLQSRTKAEDVDKFINEFVKEEVAQKVDNGFFNIGQDKNGYLIYKNKKGEILREEDVRQRAVTALQSRLEETGQMRDQYQYDQHRGIASPLTREEYQLNYQEQLVALGNKNAEEVAKQLGFQNSKIAKDYLSDQIANIGNMTDNQLTSFNYANYLQTTLNNKVLPYSQRSAINNDLSTYQLRKAQEFDINVGKALKEYENVVYTLPLTSVDVPQMDAKTLGKLNEADRSIVKNAESVISVMEGRINAIKESNPNLTDSEARKLLYEQGNSDTRDNEWLSYNNAVKERNAANVRLKARERNNTVIDNVVDPDKLLEISLNKYLEIDRVNQFTTGFGQPHVIEGVIYKKLKEEIKTNTAARDIIKKYAKEGAAKGNINFLLDPTTNKNYKSEMTEALGFKVTDAYLEGMLKSYSDSYQSKVKDAEEQGLIEPRNITYHSINGTNSTVAKQYTSIINEAIISNNLQLTEQTTGMPLNTQSKIMKGLSGGELSTTLLMENSGGKPLLAITRTGEDVFDGGELNKYVAIASIHGGDEGVEAYRSVMKEMYAKGNQTEKEKALYGLSYYLPTNSSLSLGELVENIEPENKEVGDKFELNVNNRDYLVTKQVNNGYKIQYRNNGTWKNIGTEESSSLPLIVNGRENLILQFGKFNFELSK